MEDVKKRLEFSSPFVQHQALWKLQGEIEKKAGGDQITSDTPESPEVNALWEALCEREQATLTQTAADVWLHLVVSETADFTFVLHGVLNRVPSARCLVGVVRTLAGLLSLQAVAIQESGQRYTSPYSLRAPAHPFITVLTHRPTSWPLLTSQVEELMLHDDVRVQCLSLEVLRPWVSFVLLEPSPCHPLQASFRRLELQTLILRLSLNSAGGESWLDFLVHLLPCYQVNTAEAVHGLVDHLRLLLHTLCQRHVILTDNAAADVILTDTAAADANNSSSNNRRSEGDGGKSAQEMKEKKKKKKEKKKKDDCGGDDDTAAEENTSSSSSSSSTCNLLGRLVCRVTRSALSLLLPAVLRHQLDVQQGLLQSVVAAAQHFPQCLSGETRLTQLCHVLMELGPFASPSVLRLVKQAAIISISQQPSSPTTPTTTTTTTATTTAVAAGMLVLPVLQFMAGPSPLGSSEKTGGGGSAAARQHRQVLKAASTALCALQGRVEAFQKKEEGNGSRSQESVVAATDEATPEGLTTAPAIEGQGHLLGSEVESQALADLMSVIATDLSSTCVWLTSLLRQLTGMKGSENVSGQITCVVSSVLLLHRHPAVTSLALDVLVQIARLDNTKAPLFLPLMLYCVRGETDPETRLVILEHVPLMAQHKICVPPILKTLQALLTSPKLRALSIRLMTSLWQLQDRCFPQLLKAIGEEEVSSSSLTSSSKPSSSSSSVSMSPDVLLAKAAAVKEICRLRPDQHGADLLAPLSHILQTATDQQGAAPSALAMEGLYYLCEAEVIDIQSAWNVLAKQLTSEKRGVVLVKVCRLLSLVPELSVNTPEYEEFQREVVNRLWRYTQSAQTDVQGAAFCALSYFSVDCFRVSHLPRQVCEELHLQVEMIQQQQQQQHGGEETQSIISVDSLFTFIPGVSYTRLLRSLPPQVLADYKAFLSKMVGREVEALPRGIYHAASRRHGASSASSSSGTNQDKAIASIPQFLSRHYNSTKQPGLRPSLAAALLFCFDPPVEVGRDGRPRKHYIVRHGKVYSDTFSSLLNELPVQPSEWHRSLLMPQAWMAFMERLCLALIESRGAELDMQVNQGQISEDQREEKTHTAWLFVRDNIVDILKATSKGTPSQQANAVSALAALTVFVTRYAGGLDPEVMQEADRATQHVSHAHWLTAAVDTVLSIRDVRYRPRGQLLGICQQRSADDRTAASNLAQATACVCVGTLVPSLLGTTSSSSSASASDAQVVRYLLRQLSWALPGARKASELPVLLVHNGLALGALLGKLFEEGFGDMGTAQDKRNVWESLQALEEVVLNPALEHKSGSVLGLGLALRGLCQDGKGESREHVTALWDKLSSLLDTTPPQDNSYQALCFSLACLSGSAFASNILRTDDVNATLHQMEMAHTSNPQVTGCSLGLGMLCYTLSRMGHPGLTTLRQTLTSQWLTALTSSSSATSSESPAPATVKIAALNGLMALIGSEQSMVVVRAGVPVSLTSSDVRASEVVEVVTRMVQGDPDLGMQCNAAWMLGHLHLSACSVAENRATVPPNYEYLPEASFLRAIVDLLLEAGRQGPDTVSGDHMKVALASLQDDVTRVLPPLNWAGVLSPVMRMAYGDECQGLCLTLALSQGASAPTAAMILNSWLTPPLCMSLSENSKRALFASLPAILRSVDPSILSTFLQRCCLPTLAEQGLLQGGGSGDPPAPHVQRHPPLTVVILQGLAEALRVPDPPEAVTALLHEATRQAYAALPAAEFSPELFRGMAECFEEVPDDIFDAITAEDYAPGTCSLRAFFIGCCLVARGKQPITLMNGLIDSAMKSPHCGGVHVLYSLAHGLWESVRHRKQTAGPMDRLNWLVELLGHTRNIATRVVPLSGPSGATTTTTTQPLGQAVEFSVLVVAMAFNLLTPARPSPYLGLDPTLLKVKGNERKRRMDGSKGEEDWRTEDPAAALPGWSGDLRRMFLAQLPMAVLAFESTPWDQLLPKVFDWLLTMSRLSDDLLPDDIKQSLTASLLMLRHSSEFRKTNNWTRVLATV